VTSLGAVVEEGGRGVKIFVRVPMHTICVCEKRKLEWESSLMVLLKRVRALQLR
jgi:hypothetical protein